MNPPNRPANRVTDPNALLDMITAQAHNKAYDLAMGLSAQFVNSFIRAGKIVSVEAAAKALDEGNRILQSAIEKELISMSLGEIQATLPKGEQAAAPLPGVTPNVPAKA